MKKIDVNDLRFILKGPDGKEVKCDILYEMFDENLGKVYIAYTDYVEIDGKYRILISELLKDGEDYSVTSIEDNEIYRIIENQVKTLFTK